MLDAELIDAVKKALREQGLDTPTDPGQHFCPHSWRCENPDRYPGYCTCVDDVARAVVAAVREAENKSGGVVPPYLTDRIPGHEGDQPGSKGEGHDR